MEHQELVVIVDFGGQYAQLIARRVRECGVYCEILPYVNPQKKFWQRILRQSSFPVDRPSVNALDAPKVDTRIFDAGIPVLGICYGMQLICSELGGKVARPEKREYGHAMFYRDGSSPLFEGCKQRNRRMDEPWGFGYRYAGGLWSGRTYRSDTDRSGC